MAGGVVAFANTVIRLAFIATLWLAAAGGAVAQDFLPPPKGQAALFMIAGQSNAEGRGAAKLSDRVPAGDAFFVANGKFSYLNDPVGDARSGSAWPAFANTWKSLTSETSLWIETAQGGAGLLPRSKIILDTSGPFYREMIDELHAAIASARATQGLSLTGIYVVWAQGETDARLIGRSRGTAAEYEERLYAFFTALKSDCPEIDAILVSELGAAKDGAAADAFASVRTAQENVAKRLPYVHIAFRDAKEFPARGLMRDNFHYNQEGYREMGVAMATAAASLK